MFDDLSVADLEAMRVSLREALVALATGKQTAEVRYGETGRKFHPADTKATQSLLAQVVDEIARRSGARRGGFTVMHGG